MLLLLACAPDEVTLGNLVVRVTDDQRLELERDGGVLLEVRDFAFASEGTEVQFLSGAYKFTDAEPSWRAHSSIDVVAGRDQQVFSANLLNSEGDRLGALSVFTAGADRLVLRVASANASTQRVRLSYDCRSDDIFLGTGEHSFDVEHRGEAYTLWVSEPGVGKRSDDTQGDAWFIEGTRHSTSYPDPFMLLPRRPLGLSLETETRVDVDFCKENPQLWSTVAWAGGADFVVWTGGRPLDIVAARALAVGPPSIPPDWAFAPWNDAIRGADRVREVAEKLRAAHAPSSVIWTEDWMGGVETPVGYHPKGEWEVDTTLYPEPEDLDAELESLGFKWLAYFAPFLRDGSGVIDEALPFAIKDDNGEPYWFLGYTLEQMTILDLSREDTRDWVIGKMDAALSVGFDGWMGDFGEWVPPDAHFAEMHAFDDHNSYPLYWQAVSAEALSDADGTFFSRSGWTGSPYFAPIHWAGDQRTSFDADDGLPTVIPMGLGASIAGAAVFAHDIGGYQSAGNPPSTQELWFRWCALAAFTPIMRTHHGAYSAEDWQFDTDEATLAHYARYATEHARLFPYLRGLGERATTTGTPMLLHPALVYEGADWGGIDTWLLGPNLLVAPVLSEGAVGRDVALPSGRWFNWWTGAEVTSGWHEAAMGEIPVFVADDSLIPLLTTVPDTFADATAPGVTDLADVESERTLRVFGTGGGFTEADGTIYTSSGTASAAGSSTQSLSSGTITVNGLSVTIKGTVTRAYTVAVWP